MIKIRVVLFACWNDLIPFDSRLTQVAVCNLASIALNRFVTSQKFDFKKLEYVTGVIVRNLNKIIEINYYPVPEVSGSTLTLTGDPVVGF